MPNPFSIQLQVRYGECDQQGHAFNAHYLAWFDLAHTGLLAEALNLSYPEIRASGIDVVVAESGIRHRSPAGEDDVLTIDVRLDPLTRTSMTSRYTVRCGDRLVAEAFLRHVCVVQGTTQKQTWPEDVRRALGPYVSPPRQQ